jgi:hypothetical protein
MEFVLPTGLDAIATQAVEAERAAVVAFLLAEADGYREIGHESDAITLEIALSEILDRSHLENRP